MRDRAEGLLIVTVALLLRNKNADTVLQATSSVTKAIQLLDIAKVSFTIPHTHVSVIFVTRYVFLTLPAPPLPLSVCVWECVRLHLYVCACMEGSVVSLYRFSLDNHPSVQSQSLIACTVLEKVHSQL